jgi:hypothetical protein
MIREYEVVRAETPDAADKDLRHAHTPEEAARQVLGEDLVRGGRGRGRGALCAKVYWTGADGTPSMVRLYRRPAALD